MACLSSLGQVIDSCYGIPLVMNGTFALSNVLITVTLHGSPGGDFEECQVRPPRFSIHICTCGSGDMWVFWSLKQRLLSGSLVTA